MRTVTTTFPSFPEFPVNVPLALKPGERWQVVGGDAHHWRVGYYSPEVATPAEIAELEWHDCPEFFMLLSGRVCLQLQDEAGERTLELEPLKPVIVTCRHAGFCPDGPFTGLSIVVERDEFLTEYTPHEVGATAGGGVRG